MNVGGIEVGSPVIAAPGSGDFTGIQLERCGSGEKDRKKQGLSIDDANDLCLRYRPLAFRIAGEYRNRGVDLGELRSAGLFGLVLATKKFDPDRGIAFGGYAQYWIRGEITALFKRNNPLDRAQSLTVKSEDGTEYQRGVADAASPVIAPDLSGLDDRQRLIIQARNRGETLAEIGKGLGLSAERIRQIEALARPQIRGAIASECLSDLTQRGDRGNVIRFPVERTRKGAVFCDRAPPKHIYSEPKPSRELAHHRAKASHLAALRGNAPLRNSHGPYGGPVIHAWGRS